MRQLISPRTFLLGACLALGLSLTPAQGAFLATESVNVLQINATTYFYSYTIAVSASSTNAVSEFDLQLGGPITAIVAPSNFFSFYTDGDPFISFTAYDIGAPFVGITPGSSGTFSFFSTYAPSMGAYQTYGLDTASGLVAGGGMTLVPNVVPEPSSLVLAGLGLVGVGGGMARARRRRLA